MSSDYPNKPTNKAQINSKFYGGRLLGKNSLGSVHIHGPYGNNDSNIKIAYLIGMHPMESKSHRALFECIRQHHKKLDKKYFIYNTHVNNIDKITEGRMDGQLLAQEFIAPHVIENNYDFVVDVHSNKGLRGPGKYEKTNFIFSPGFDENSTHYQDILLSQIEELVYYAPEYRTSPEYITIPIVNSGVATIVYETFSYEDMKKTRGLAKKLVFNVDKLEL